MKQVVSLQQDKIRTIYLHGYLRSSECVLNLFFLPNNFKKKKTKIMQFSFPYAAISLVVSITVAFVTFGKNIFDSILVACHSYYDCLFLFFLNR